MTKVSNEQILSIKALSETGKSSVEVECKKLKISPATYYKRRKALVVQVEKIERSIESLRKDTPVTLQAIQNEMQAILDELKAMRGKDTREQLSIMDRKIAALDKLNNTLKTTQIMIDNRSVNIEVKAEVERDVCQWVYDMIERKGGAELASKVLDMLQGD